MPHRNILMKGILHDWLTGNDADMEKALNALKDMDIILRQDSPVYLLWLQILSWSSQPLDFLSGAPLSKIYSKIFSAITAVGCFPTALTNCQWRS